MTKKQREEIEYFLCEFYDAIDPTKTNSEYMQSKWANMSDTQFENWLKRDYPLQYQHKAFENEPTFTQYFKAAKVIGCDLTDEVALPYLYINDKGVPVNSKKALKMRLHIKKVQQFITKKNKVSMDIDDRDMKGGRLNTDDKGAATSDREFESLALFDLNDTVDEFSTIKADAMNAKSEAYAQIAATGILSKEDYSVAKDDSLSRNMISAYMLAQHIETNLVNQNGYTPYTLKEKERKTSRSE